MNSLTSPPVPSVSQRRHILVVEDKVELRYVLAEWLRMQKYAVVEAANADEALVLLESLLQIDLVVSDVHMPGSMDGLGLARTIAERFPHVKVVIASGEADKRHIPPNMVFFRKPYDLQNIAKAIRKLLSLPEPEGGE